MYDLAIAINSLCFVKNKIDYKKTSALIKGYNAKRKINNKEKKYLTILCFGAAIRYFVTRLYDMKFTPKKALVEKKDPIEYLIKMRFLYKNFNKLNNYFENKNLY